MVAIKPDAGTQQKKPSVLTDGVVTMVEGASFACQHLFDIRDE
jgi:hypothetical protein